MKARNPAGTARLAVLAAIALVALASVGCSPKLLDQLLPNQAPEVRLTAAPAARDSLHPDHYSYTMQWMGYDPDGRVAHFLYSVDPTRHPVDPAHPNGFDLADTCWHATARNDRTFSFSAKTPIEPIGKTPKAESPHEFAIYAVDDRGKVSTRPAQRAFFSYTQAPSVNVSDPLPNAAFGLNLTPSVRISWTGTDPDGQSTSKPVRWVFRLFGRSNSDFPLINNFISFAQVYQDSLRKLYAPDFKGWSSVGADTTSHQYTSLGQTDWMFVVTGFDEAGAYDPIFSRGKNILVFSVIFANTAGPVIRMFNTFFDYTYDYGGFDESEARWFRLEIPASTDERHIPVTFNWSATPAPGADIQRFRWGLDLVDLSDNRARLVESEWRERRWSAWRRNTQSATIGPFFNNGESHLFFIEAEDNNNLLSLGIIYFTVVLSTFEKELLLIDDTRLNPDFLIPGTSDVAAPIGAWPMAAELDTFLYAKGGVPWRGRDPGTLSTPGIFNGYGELDPSSGKWVPFDTIGTRGISLDGTVPLSVLGRYRHLVWYVDNTSASYSRAPNDPAQPITALRLINSPRRPAILSTYLSQASGRADAGFVWLAGGGAASATLNPYNVASNGVATFTRDAGELQPGRLMYDYAHWQVIVSGAPVQRARKFGTVDFGGGSVPRSPLREWPSNPPLPTPAVAPNYTRLPQDLEPKSPGTDPLPAGRTSDPVNFYTNNTYTEVIPKLPGAETWIREDYGPDPDHLRNFSTLDTLYLTLGGSVPIFSPCMTYYHGRECQPFMFSGFNFWYWRRTNCIDLVDWVLQDVWGLQRDPGASRVLTPMARRRAAP